MKNRAELGVSNEGTRPSPLLYGNGDLPCGYLIADSQHNRRCQPVRRSEEEAEEPFPRTTVAMHEKGSNDGALGHR
jgi:hypothetical protein